MKEINETFSIKFSGEDNKVYVIARDNGEHNVSTGRYSADLTTKDMKRLASFLVVTANRIDNDPDFNETKSKESS